MWFRAAAKFIAPELIFPIRCQSCRKWTELLDHEYTDLEEGFLVRYRRCWQCPSCGDRAFETGTFFRHPDHWDVC
jgi:uncharacterized protein with PIN domain